MHCSVFINVTFLSVANGTKTLEFEKFVEHGANLPRDEGSVQ